MQLLLTQPAAATLSPRGISRDLMVRAVGPAPSVGDA
jgi:hypothetical protein